MTLHAGSLLAPKHTLSTQESRREHLYAKLKITAADSARRQFSLADRNDNADRLGSTESTWPLTAFERRA